MTGSELDELIAPEIKRDPFYEALVRVASDRRVRHILEIGSSSGEGSTEAFVKGALMQSSPPDLYCMEVSRIRYEALVRRYRRYPFVHCYNLSSVPLDCFPSPDDVEQFYRTFDSKLRKTPLPEVLRWLEQDKQYLRDHHADRNGIQAIRESHGIETFDAVLIDGSEFTGRAELEETYGARFILLDDTETFKNWGTCRRLRDDLTYRLVEHRPEVRNGYAVFERVE
jgi:hypothetical protein